MLGSAQFVNVFLKRPVIRALDEDFGCWYLLFCLSFRFHLTILFPNGVTTIGVKPGKVRLLIVQQNVDVGILLAILVILETKQAFNLIKIFTQTVIRKPYFVYV